MSYKLKLKNKKKHCKLLVSSQEVKKLTEYLPSMKLDCYSFELCQERVGK